MRPRRRLALLIAVCGVCSALDSAPIAAQGSGPGQAHGIVLPTSAEADGERLRQLRGDTANLDGYLLRSPSRESAWLLGSAKLMPLPPDVEVVANSALPFSMNDGALWAGRGANLRVTGGVTVRAGDFRLIVAPEWWVAANARFDFQNRGQYYFTAPIVPETRYGKGFANPWYAQPYSADLPWRYGSSALARLVPGQTGLWYSTGAIDIGATTENTWWGPGIRNAIVMSDNAAGIPRLELRTHHPIATRFGRFDAVWFAGALSESRYFDTTKANNARSLAAAAVTWRPNFQPTLTVGATRAVYASAPSYGAALTRWFDVFANAARPSGSAATDSTLKPGGREQLVSLFARWVFPDDGFETYVEWARQNFPHSLRDFAANPSRSAGYTLGAQYRKPVPAGRATFRVQAEVTNLEQNGEYRNAPISVFYTSRHVLQGYTELGQPIGAAIGPGGSSQWLALDRVWDTGAYGLTVNRIRWNEDVRSTYPWPAYLVWCNHDVSILPGVRGGHTALGGYVSSSFTLGERLNYNFQNVSGCRGSARVDVKNSTFSISFSPFRR